MTFAIVGGLATALAGEGVYFTTKYPITTAFATSVVYLLFFFIFAAAKGLSREIADRKGE